MQGIPSRIDYKGKRFGDLLVMERRGERGGSWLCLCDCGNKIVLPASDFVSGGQIACGCKKGKGMLKHGMWDTTFYKKWDGMHRRCTNPTMHNYELYGGRGIKCIWKSFEDFRDDMYVSYLAHNKRNEYTSIERIDNNGNYCKENCRWANRVEQANNRRTNKNILYNGRTQTMSQWADEFGMPKTTLWGRLKRGIEFEKAIV